MKRARRTNRRDTKLLQTASTAGRFRWPSVAFSPWRMLAAAAVVIAVSLAVFLRLRQWQIDPDFPLLVEQPGAAWIRPSEDFSLVARRTLRTEAGYIFDFQTPRTISQAVVRVRAFREFTLILDGKILYRSSDHRRSWKEPYDVALRGPIPLGPHRLGVIVVNSGGHPCLWLQSDDLGIQTDEHWLATLGNMRLTPVRLATEWVSPPVALTYPRVVEVVPTVAPWLIAVFILSLLWNLWGGAQWERSQPKAPLDAARVRWIVIAAWLVLFANNASKIPASFGFDCNAHLEYIRFIATQGALPISTDGWQMFQSPLFYLLASPFYAILSPTVSDETLLKVFRILPMLCGLANIELVFRTARLVFPDRDDAQSIATLVAGLLPMHVYLGQVIGNEPLAAALTSAVIYHSARLLIDPKRPRSLPYYGGFGALWGLALLAKVTPLLLGPALVAVVVVVAQSSARPICNALVRAAALLAGCSLTSGWFFVRNWLRIGRPFVGGWDPASGNIWWQDPGYRTWSQLTSFGTALDRPVYSGAWSLWDGMYSTLWLDGFTSGFIQPPDTLPWNVNWLVAGAWLALVPLALMVTSVATLWQGEFRPARGVLLLAWSLIGIYLTALVDLFVQLPVYSTSKASYTLGLLPCYGLLAAAGAAPLLRYRWPGAVVQSAMFVWAVTSFVAYFVVTGR